MSGTPRVVLVTGCSSGIGRATALRLVDDGHTVYATARQVDDIVDLGKRGCSLAALDVTDEASMREVVDRVVAEHGAVEVLINNAGYSLSGPLEELPTESVRRQLETNVIGPLRLSQLALPGMRERGWGRIVNVSSMGGRITFPGGGAYHASKHALEAWSDVLRFEVAGFGVDVVVIEPGLVRTGFARRVSDEMPPPREGPYRRFSEEVEATTRSAYEQRPVVWFTVGPERVASVIARAIEANHPRPRYRTDAVARTLIAIHRLLPSRLWDRMVGLSFPQPGRKQ